MCAGILGLQTIALVPVASLLLPTTDLPTWLGLIIGVGLPLLCLAGAATMRGRAGGVVGWVAEAATILAGFATPWLFGLGVVFAALYAGCWTLGARIDRERAAAIAAYAAEQAEDTEHPEQTEGTPADGGPDRLG
jgi:hypothetical protein